MSWLKAGVHILFALLIGLVIAISLFIGVLAITSPTEPIDNNEINLDATANPANEKNQTAKPSFNLGQSQSFIDCVENHQENNDTQTPKSMTDAVRDCSQKEKPEKQTIQEKPEQAQVALPETPKTACELAASIPFFCGLSKQFFIQFIYLLQFCALWIQTSLVISMLLARLFKQAPQDYPAAARWAVDAPPILGVVGTLYAFSVAATVGASASALRLSEVFRASFEDAVLTTMVGGLIYVINLALNILKDSNVKVS